MATAKRNPAEELPADRPPILGFFERAGLVKGRKFSTVTTTSGGAVAYFGPAVIEDIAAVSEPGAAIPAEIVIVFAEPGMKKKRYVRYSQLVSWHDED